jgi:poly-beta-1,6-N-acetyl-D-glucosamine synthase
MTAVVALAALALVVYTYAGYPVAVAVWSRLAPRKTLPETGSYEPSVSICISVYNGAEFVASKLQSLQALDYPRDRLEILVFSDGSNDGTEELVREFAQADSRISLLASPERKGKPAAVNRLRAAATGEVLVMTDIRQPLSKDSVRELVRPLQDPSIGCVSGLLVLAGNTGAGAYWRYEKAIRGSESRLGWMVGVSGSLYAVRKADLAELPDDVLLDDMFVPLSVARSRKSIVLSARAEAYDDACDDDREFSRKVRTLAGNYQLVAKLPWLLVPGKNPVWFAIVSHKLLRLVCPWALMALFLASAPLAFDGALPANWLAFFRALFLGQLGFYGLAALGPVAGKVGSLARTFVVLNAAALVGLWRFMRGTQAVTW